MHGVKRPRGRFERCGVNRRVAPPTRLGSADWRHDHLTWSLVGGLHERIERRRIDFPCRR